MRRVERRHAQVNKRQSANPLSRSQGHALHRVILTKTLLTADLHAEVMMTVMVRPNAVDKDAINSVSLLTSLDPRLKKRL
jgi:hypothetical protein